jgi:hypothetical protein
LSLTIGDLDEVLFRIDEVLNYRAEVSQVDSKDLLHLCFYVVDGAEQRVLNKVTESLHKDPFIKHVLEENALNIGSIIFIDRDWFTNGANKRKLFDKRSEGLQRQHDSCCLRPRNHD